LELLQPNLPLEEEEEDGHTNRNPKARSEDDHSTYIATYKDSHPMPLNIHHYAKHA
jgi:hypothetical protein